MLVINPTDSAAIKSAFCLSNAAASKNLGAISPVVPTPTDAKTDLGTLTLSPVVVELNPTLLSESYTAPWLKNTSLLLNSISLDGWLVPKPTDPIPVVVITEPSGPTFNVPSRVESPSTFIAESKSTSL